MNTHSYWSHPFSQTRFLIGHILFHEHEVWLDTPEVSHRYCVPYNFPRLCCMQQNIMKAGKGEELAWNIVFQERKKNNPSDIWKKCKEPTEDNLVEGRKCIHSVKIPDWHGNSKTWRECNSSHGNGRDFHLSWTSRLGRTSFWSFIKTSQQDYLKARFLFVNILRPCVAWSYNHIHKWSRQKVVLWCSVRV